MISKDNLKMLNAGMSMDEVRRLFGKPDYEHESDFGKNIMGNTAAAMALAKRFWFYYYDCREGGSLMLMFEAGQLNRFEHGSNSAANVKQNRGCNL